MGNVPDLEAQKDAELAALKAAGMARDPKWAPWRDAAYSERLFREQYALEAAEAAAEIEAEMRAVNSHDALVAGLRDIERKLKCGQTVAARDAVECLLVSHGGEL